MPDEYKKGFLEAITNPVRPFAPIAAEVLEQIENSLAFLASGAVLLKEAKTIEDAEESLRLFKINADKMLEIHDELSKKLKRIKS